MRKYWSLLLLIIAMACSPAKKTSEKDVITVTILPQKYFVERIAGELAEVNVLVPPGASPELYSLVPSQLKDVARSKAWLRLDYIGFELAWFDKIMATQQN